MPSTKRRGPPTKRRTGKSNILARMGLIFAVLYIASMLITSHISLSEYNKNFGSSNSGDDVPIDITNAPIDAREEDAPFKDAPSEKKAEYNKQFGSSNSGDDVPIDITNAPIDAREENAPSKDAPSKKKAGKGPEQASPIEPRRILTAYLEPINLSDWSIKPLPIRNTTSSTLQKITYPKLASCQKLPSQFPIDDYPANDPFLPWIHDAFPSHDGAHIQIVAQNKRRCNTGKAMGHLKRKFQPNIALFQHVPVKRTPGNRYQITTHEDADADGTETRFICRFQPSGIETLSEFNFNYDHATWRKRYESSFTEEGFDNHIIWTSQLIFKCPVPEELREVVRKGTSVVEDAATLFFDLIPIRTPPRYCPAYHFLPPRYMEKTIFDVEKEYGEHLLPKIEDSGRWENIPICKPSLMTYDSSELEREAVKEVAKETVEDPKKNTLVACTWATTQFKTRGGMEDINDGYRRTKEWITFHLATGFDHIYVYDNSGQFSKTESLLPVTSLFPASQVTRIDWPAKVCNNNKKNGDNKGERSSQYAAESSCRLRFGPHTEWLVNFDTDEYLIPVGKYRDMKDVLATLGDNNILSFKSARARPRIDLIEQRNERPCARGGVWFDPVVPEDRTFLQTYNCDQEKAPKTHWVPAEKQIYRTSHVLQHFIHYSSVTQHLVLPKSEYGKHNLQWTPRYNDKLNHWADEVTEGIMLHTKSIATDLVANWKHACKIGRFCHLGFPWPNGIRGDSNRTEDGQLYNCYVNDVVEDIYVPMLEEAMKSKQ